MEIKAVLFAYIFITIASNFWVKQSIYLYQNKCALSFPQDKCSKEAWAGVLEHISTDIYNLALIVSNPEVSI